MKKKPSKYTKISVHKIALKYNHRSIFREKDFSFYIYAIRKGWINEICSHMTRKKHTWKDKVTYKQCEELAKKSSLSKFSSSKFGAIAKQNKWFNKLSKFCTTQFLFTIELCNDEAKKYDNPKEFRINSRGAYDAAKKNGWLLDICTHMKKVPRYKF